MKIRFMQTGNKGRWGVVAGRSPLLFDGAPVFVHATRYGPHRRFYCNFCGEFQGRRLKDVGNEIRNRIFKMRKPKKEGNRAIDSI